MVCTYTYTYIYFFSIYDLPEGSDQMDSPIVLNNETSFMNFIMNMVWHTFV